MKAYRERRGALHSLLVPSLDESKLSLFGKRSWYPLNTKLIGPRPVLDSSEKIKITNLCRTVPPLVQWLLREVQNSFNTAWQKCSWVTCMWPTEWEQTVCSVLYARQCRVLLYAAIRIYIYIYVAIHVTLFSHQFFSKQNRSVCLSVYLSIYLSVCLSGVCCKSGMCLCFS